MANGTLQTTLAAVEAERDSLSQQLQTSQTRLDQLSRDQSELQKLHEQLTGEYDALLGEKEQLKASQRELKGELRLLNDKVVTSLQVIIVIPSLDQSITQSIIHKDKTKESFSSRIHQRNLIIQS